MEAWETSNRSIQFRSHLVPSFYSPFLCRLFLLFLLQVGVTPQVVLAADPSLITPAEASKLIRKARARGTNLTREEVDFLYEKSQVMHYAGLEKAERELLKIIVSSKYVRAKHFVKLANSITDETGDENSAAPLGEKYLKEALKLDPECSEAYGCLATLSLIDGDKKKALSYSTRAVNCKVPDETAYVAHANVLSILKRYEQALESINRAETKFKLPAEPYRIKGSILENLARYAEAEQAYRKAQSMQKKDWTFFRLVHCLECQKKYAEAIGEMDKLIAANPKDGEAFRVRAKIKVKNKDLNGALKDMDKAVQLDPTTVSYKERAQIHSLLGHKDLADKDLKESETIKNMPF